MCDLPVVLHVAGRRCVVVGGGSVASRRAASLHEVGAEVVVIAANIDSEHEQALLESATAVHRRAYQQGDLDNAMLVIVATDDIQVNEQVAAEAKAKGVLVNRADESAKGDIAIPAHAHHGPVTIAVHTSGISAAAAAAIRQELSAALDPAWPVVLEVVAPFREAIRCEISDPAVRQQRLRQMIDEQAVAAFKWGGPEALRRHCEYLVGQPEKR